MEFIIGHGISSRKNTSDDPTIRVLLNEGDYYRNAKLRIVDVE